jgi:hypothetical protein
VQIAFRNLSLLEINRLIHPTVASKTIQFTFGNNYFSIGTGNPGNEPGSFDVLTGCTVITLVSRRAVYTGHFWELKQGDAWRNPPAKFAAHANPSASFQQNVINHVLGQQPTYQATGPPIDPTLFNRADDQTYLFVTTPRSTGFWTNPDGPMRYPNFGAGGLFETTIKQIIPNVQPLYYYYKSQKAKTYAGTEVSSQPPHMHSYFQMVLHSRLQQSYRQGQTLFEYDPQADGTNPDWRLFIWGLRESGSSLGQIVA